MRKEVKLKNRIVLFDSEKSYSGSDSCSDEEKNIREALGLPLTDQLVFYEKTYTGSAFVLVEKFRVVEVYVISDPWYTIEVTLKDVRLKRIHSDYFLEMQEYYLTEMSKKNLHTYEFTCRGCGYGNRYRNWLNYQSSISTDLNRQIDNAYLTLEEEPDNPHDPNAIKVVVCGEFYGLVGYVGREFTTEVYQILEKCVSYRVDMKDEDEIGKKEIHLVLTYVIQQNEGQM